MPVDLFDAAATEAAGRRFAALLQPGDLVILTGDLGAGKTTFSRGVGAGLHVRGPVTSPTFVIARSHPSLVGGPELLHVDAYRLDTAEQLWDLDLDTEQSVTVVEWGRGKAESLADEWVELTFERRLGASPTPGGQDDRRRVSWYCKGERWTGVDLSAVLSGRAHHDGTEIS